MTDSHEPPCPYCGPIKDLRAAEQTEQTPDQQFAQRYANMRMRQLADEQQTLDDDAETEIRALAAHRRTLAEDLAEYEPADPYELEGEKR